MVYVVHVFHDGSSHLAARQQRLALVRRDDDEGFPEDGFANGFAETFVKKTLRESLRKAYGRISFQYMQNIKIPKSKNYKKYKKYKNYKIWIMQFIHDTKYSFLLLF